MAKMATRSKTAKETLASVRSRLEAAECELADLKASVAREKLTAKAAPVEQASPSPAVAPVPVAPAGARLITPQAALEAVLIAWLSLNDFARWAFVQGTAPDEPLSDIDLKQIEGSVSQMNAIHSAAKHFARQIAGKNDPAAVLKAAIDKVRAEYKSALTLTVLNMPTVF